MKNVAYMLGFKLATVLNDNVVRRNKRRRPRHRNPHKDAFYIPKFKELDTYGDQQQGRDILGG